LATIALDATYSLGPSLSGVGVYSREILYGLAAAHPSESWDWFYRSNRFWRGLLRDKPSHVTSRYLADSWGNRSAAIFHGLNQRLPKRRFRRQIATFHDLFVLSGEYSTPEFRARFAAQAKEAAAAADLIITVSAFTAGQVEHYLGVPASRIRVIHHGAIPRPIPSLPREKVVLCVGAIQKRKNQATLIRAFLTLPDEWTLVLAGSEGFDAQAVIQGDAVSGQEHRIRITGYLTEEKLVEWYARASIFAFPSLDEGFGMPILEAMAAGVPVISSSRSAMPEVCGDAAELIDPTSVDELASALLRLATDQSRRGELIARGLDRAKQFPWEKAVEKTWAVYQELL
jgi:glycosyltransferase involved in cell wall biosynthesis